MLSPARCAQGGASYLTFYQPGLHVVNDRTGKERCLSSLQATGAGTYWHYYTQLPAGAGASIIYNVAANRSRLRDALETMCRTPVCEEPTEIG